MEKKQDHKKLAEELLERDLEENAINIKDVNIMFLDISSTCVGYSIASVDFTNKRADLTDCGCIWLDNKWEHQEKYSYMFHAISEYFWIVKKIDHIVVEQYSVNPKKMMGVNIVSEMQGAIKCAAQENNVKVTNMAVQTWRSVLGIKVNKTVNSKGTAVKDYKEPTKLKVQEFLDVPERVISNITNKERSTPSDLYDATAIAIAWLTKNNFKVACKKSEFNTHIGVFDNVA